MFIWYNAVYVCNYVRHRHWLRKNWQKRRYEKTIDKSSLTLRTNTFSKLIVLATVHKLFSGKEVTKTDQVKATWSLVSFFKDDKVKSNTKHDCMAFLHMVFDYEKAKFMEWWKKYHEDKPKTVLRSYNQYLNEARSSNTLPYYTENEGGGIYKGIYLVLHTLYPDDGHYKLKESVTSKDSEKEVSEDDSEPETSDDKSSE